MLDEEQSKVQSMEKRPDTMEEKIDAIDRVSQLPENIIHHILSFLPTKDVVCTSILSKTWRCLWHSFPISDFDEKLFAKEIPAAHRQRPEVQVNSNEFMNFVDNCLLRLRERNIGLQRFKLVMTLHDHDYAFRVNHLIKLALNNNLKMLDLCIRTTEKNTWYSLQLTTFATKPLSVIRLTGCKLEQASFLDTIKFFPLQELSLVEVHVDEQIIHNIILSCPLIRIFIFKRCLGVKNLHLSHLPKLEKVKVCQSYNKVDVVERIEIETLNLQAFHYDGNFKACEINVSACRNLVELKLKTIFISNEWFQGFISNFPLLNTLVLFRCHELKRFELGRFRISSHQLKTLVLRGLRWLVEAEIDTPNLQSFVFTSSRSPPSLSIDTSSLQSATLELSVNLLYTRWFLQLRKFLGKFGQNAVLTLHICSGSDGDHIWNLEELKDICIPPLYVIKHLKLITMEGRESRNFVNGLLWSSHPKTLSVLLGSSYQGSHEFIECLYGMLIYRGDQTYCCESSHIKCWRHDLKDYRITRVNNGKIFNSNDLIDLTPDLLDLLPTEEIHIEFEWLSY